MIENFIQSHDYNGKIIYPSEIDCRKHYAIICRFNEQEYPWDYANEYKVSYVGLSGTGMVINSTSSTAYISMPLFGSFS